MVKHRVRVGLHARNDVHFTEPDYALLRTARIETLKMMSFTDPAVYERVRRECAATNGAMEFIVRLYDDRIRRDSRPSPAAFVDKMVPIIRGLRPYALKFEIHNEPNHVDGIEGWGASDENARAFRDWYMQVLTGLKAACPWAQFGFPGLALNHPHRDLSWLDICQEAILASDWLGCHCYWQYGNMLKQDWGLRFKLYHERFPRMPIEITEFGNSTPNLPRDRIAEQYVAYYSVLNQYPYLGSASAFIASSPDPTWSLFVWLKEGGEVLPVAHAVRDMPRTAQEVPTAPAKPQPGPKPPPKPPARPPATTARQFPQTGKTVRGTFLKFYDQYGMDICGYPITDEIKEDGTSAQYFQRLALEEYQPDKVRLKLVGTEAWTSREKIARLEAQVRELRDRSGAGVVKPPLKDVVDQLPVHPTKAYSLRSLSDINRIVIHHTATSPTITAQRLAEYMVQTMAKPAMAYHFFIAADGQIYQTSDLQTATDHAYSRSRDSIGICFAGNFTSGVPTTAQLEAGVDLCAWLLDYLHLTSDVIVGLSELVQTQSPGLQWLGGQRWKDSLLAGVNARLQQGGQDMAPQVADLQRPGQAPQDEVTRQPVAPATVPEGPSADGIVDKLTDLVVSLQAQIHILQRELAKVEAAAEAQVPDRSQLVTDLQAWIKALREETKQRHSRVEATLQAVDVEPAPFVADLQAYVGSLEEEIQKLCDGQPAPGPSQTRSSGPLKIAVPPIQDLTEKLLTHETKRYRTRPRTDINTLVIHHSAAPATVGPQQIAAYHVNRLDWPGAGYHYLVDAEGVIYQANAVENISHHAASVNPRSVGICFLGNFQADVPPSAQLWSGAHLVAWLMQELKVDLDAVKGHKEFMQTACPGIQWLEGQSWKRMLRQAIVQIQQWGRPLPIVNLPKAIDHYMLFWARDGQWARQDWLNAQNYIGAFRPTAGFSADEAAQAEYVTIVGGTLGVPGKVEAWLQEQGCKVDRIAGKDEADTKRILDELAASANRFQHQEA